MTEIMPETTPSSPHNDAASPMVTVWDPLIRIGHWVLVAAFAVAYVTEGEPEGLHIFAGYAIVVTVALRIIWGFIGPESARFASFVGGPGAAVAYVRDELTGTAKRYLGHNPAAGLMAVALLASLTMTTVSGMAMLAEKGEGPLAPILGPAATVTMKGIAPAHADEDGHDHTRIPSPGARHGEADRDGHDSWEEVHELFANLTLGLVILHILGAIGGSLVHRENLVRAMIDGRKRAA